MGEIGTFFYGFLMRLSGAVGLHHMIYPLFWYTELGGTEVVNGETIIGAQKSSSPNSPIQPIKAYLPKVHVSSLDVSIR